MMNIFDYVLCRGEMINEEYNFKWNKEFIGKRRLKGGKKL
jgi:hypothetical protein